MSTFKIDDVRIPSIICSATKATARASIYEAEGFNIKHYEGKGFNTKHYEGEGFIIKHYEGEGFNIKHCEGEGFNIKHCEGESFNIKRHESEGFNIKHCEGEGFNINFTSSLLDTASAWSYSEFVGSIALTAPSDGLYLLSRNISSFIKDMLYKDIFVDTRIKNANYDP